MKAKTNKFHRFKINQTSTLLFFGIIMASNSSSTLEKLKSFIASPCSSQDFEVESLQNEESAELVSIIKNFGTVLGKWIFG